MAIQKNCLFFKSYATHPLPASLHCKYNFPASQMLSSTKLFLHSLYTITNILHRLHNRYGIYHPHTTLSVLLLPCLATPTCLCSSYLVVALTTLSLLSPTLPVLPHSLALLLLPCLAPPTLSLLLLPCLAPPPTLSLLLLLCLCS